jgi:hypothetical protein
MAALRAASSASNGTAVFRIVVIDIVVDGKADKFPNRFESDVSVSGDSKVAWVVRYAGQGD